MHHTITKSHYGAVGMLAEHRETRFFGWIDSRLLSRGPSAGGCIHVDLGS